VVALKRYLKYAQTGNLDLPTSSQTLADTAFENEVLQALQSLGCDVATQVGSADFRIDLAVRDRDNPDHYLLGVECDGPSYHSARSARDRDRLRRTVLENMGWHIHHIWSTDWFRNPENELQRTMAAVEAAREKTAATPPPAAAANLGDGNQIDRHQERPQTRLLQAQPYQTADLHLNTTKDLHDVPLEQLMGWVQYVVDVEGPVHIDEVRRRIVDAAETRLGSRIKAAIDEAVTRAVQLKVIHRRGDFLWNETMKYRVRSHAAMPEFNRRLEQIAPEEVMMAVRTVVGNALGMYREDIPSAVCGFLGFGRTSEEMRGHVDGLVEEMIATGQLKWRGDYLISG
jgi:very-short-patch-repair endonuclease